MTTIYTALLVLGFLAICIPAGVCALGLLHGPCEDPELEREYEAGPVIREGRVRKGGRNDWPPTKPRPKTGPPGEGGREILERERYG